MRGMYGDAPVAATIGINALSSPAVFIGGASRVALEIPAFTNLITATANIYVKACATENGTFYRVKDMGTYSANSGLQDWEVPSTAGGFIVICDPAIGFNYICVESSKTATAAFSAKVHVMQ